MVPGLMTHVADKSTIGLELPWEAETVQDKQRNVFDVGILYPLFTNSNLEVSRENGDKEHIQLQITIQIWGYNVKKRAHYIIV